MKKLMAEIVLALTLLSACARGGKDENDGPSLKPDLENAQLQSSILDYSGFQYPSFDDVSLEQKCDGLKQFFEYIAKKYMLSDVKIDIDTSGCGVPSSFYKPGKESVEIQITYSRNDKFLKLLPKAQLVYSSESYQIAMKEPDFGIINPFREELEYPYTDFIGFSVSSLVDVFTEWVNKNSKRDSSNLVSNYLDFLSNIEKKFGSESQGLKLNLDSSTKWLREPVTEGPDALDLEKRWLKVQFEPSNEIGVGKLKILDIGLEVFRELDHQGKAIDYPFFGCMDNKCLRDKEFTYRFYGANLYLVGDIEIDGQRESVSRFIYRFSRDEVQNI
jgi:hypothetical protein